MRDLSNPVVASEPRRSLALACARGYGAGLLIVIVWMAYLMMRHGVRPGQGRLAGYLVLYLPVLGLAVGCLLWRGAGRMPENAPEEGQERRPRRRGRFVEAGVAIGLAYGLIVTALGVWWRGWVVLAMGLVFNLLLFPLVGLIVGTNSERLLEIAGH
ncbi:MAG: hypothetical protein ACLQIB_28610 [Isosphaeraceae bacterium]